MLFICYSTVKTDWLGLFRAFLTNKESENDDGDSYPLPKRQLLMEEAKHDKCGKDRPDIVEYIRLRYAEVTDTKAEENKRCNGTECGKVYHAANRRSRKRSDYPLRIGRNKQFAKGNKIKEHQAGELSPKDNREGIVFGRDFSQNNAIRRRHTNRNNSKRNRPIRADFKGTATRQDKHNHTGCGDQYAEDIPNRDFFAQENKRKYRCNKRIRTQKRLCNSRCGKEFIAVGFKDEVQERLKQAAKYKKPYIILIYLLQAENGVSRHRSIGNKTNNQHHQNADGETRENKRQRSKRFKRRFDCNTGAGPYNHGSYNGNIGKELFHTSEL